MPSAGTTSCSSSATCPGTRDNRDLVDPDYCRLALYEDLRALAGYEEDIEAADAVMVGSYVPEGVAVGEWVQRTARGATAFYDIDTPVTLAKLERGDLEYLSPALIPGYDLYLSFTGGPTLRTILRRYGSPDARALYCSVDPEAYPPMDLEPRWDLSYLGTYSPDRQPTLERLLVEPARQAPHLQIRGRRPALSRRHRVAGKCRAHRSCAPGRSRPLLRIEPVHAERHAGRHDPGRLQPERAAVRGRRLPRRRSYPTNGPGLRRIFVPGREIVVADRAAAVLEVLTGWSETERRRLGSAARERVLADHTAAHRAGELEAHIARVRSRRATLKVAREAQCATAGINTG